MKIEVGSEFYHNTKPIVMIVHKINVDIDKMETSIHYEWEDLEQYTGGYSRLPLLDFVRIINLEEKNL